VVVVEREPDDILLGLRVRLRRALGETVHRDQTPVLGLSQARQCGEEVFLMLVTGAPPIFGGGGMPQRIIVGSRSVPRLRKTGAGLVLLGASQLDQYLAHGRYTDGADAEADQALVRYLIRNPASPEPTRVPPPFPSRAFAFGTETFPASAN
jgi:hypothetical protein